jgi:copper homeostasis protein CutC
MLQVRSTATPLSLTFHRAFDVINLSESTVEDALQHILDIGCDRLLTSGMAHKAFTEEGMNCLKKLTQYTKVAAPWFIVIAASGINAENCAQLLAATGVHGIHAGGSVTDGISTSDMTPVENGVVSDFNTRQVVSTTRVQELVLSCTSISDVI